MPYQDVRIALRSLRKTPVFTVVAISSLALGIGANTAIFSLIDQMLLRMLPVKEPRQLVQMAARGSHYGSNWGMNSMSYPMYRDIRDRNQVFADVMCRRATPLSLGYSGQTERVASELVSGNYFRTLGVTSVAGRLIAPEDDQKPGAHPVAVLAYSFWKSRFASDPQIVGKNIELNGMSMTVIGVAADGFQGMEVGETTQVFVPVMMQKQMIPVMSKLYSFEDRRSRWLNVFARLKPGVTRQQAQASVEPLYKDIIRMEVMEPAFRNASAFRKQKFLESRMEVSEAATGQSHMRRLYEMPLKVLMAITFAVLLIACANVANLLVARSAVRQKEMAIRMAMGASRAQIVSQLLTECFVLSMGAALFGVWVGQLMVRFLLQFVNTNTSPLTITAALDPRVLGFSMALAVATTFLFGLIPALQTSKPKIATTLKDQAGAVVGGSGHAGLRKTLVTVQMGLSLVLLIACGLFVRSLWNLRDVNPGFRVERLVRFSVDPPQLGYTNAQTLAFFERLGESMKGLPGYQSASHGLVDLLGGDGEEWDSTVTVEGYQAKQGENMSPHFNAVGPEYFATLGVPLIAGRDFNRNDQPKSQKVCLVNQTFAKRYFGDGVAVGKHIGQGGDPGTKLNVEIIGVVGDAKYETVRKDVPRQVFLPFSQLDFATGLTFYVRTTAEPDTFFRSLRAVVRNLDPKMPLYSMRTMQEQADRTLVTERMIASLSTAFGVLATLLAVVGIYGVMAYTVARRSREIGIRMALGADTSRVIRMIMRETGVMIGLGIGVALPLAYWLSRYVRSQLYGVAPTDPWMIAAAMVVLAAAAGLAGFVPALRASKVDPLRVLRYE